MNKRKKGFTLVELLAVIVVLAIVSAIGAVMVGGIIQSVQDSAELANARTLLQMVKDNIVINEMNGNSPNVNNKTRIYIIKDDIEYTTSDTAKIRTKNFKYRGKLCDFCVIKVNSNNQISILMEGKRQDITKDFDDKELKVKPLTLSREDTSLYNELSLFRDIYVSNDKNSYPRRFAVDGTVVESVSQEGYKSQFYTLENSSGKAKLYINSATSSSIIIEKDGSYIEKDSSGNLITSEDINKEYSNDILELYEELKYVTNSYTLSHDVTSEMYFEFENGVIKKKDIYGNDDNSVNLTMNKNISGSGEFRINTSKHVSITIYQDNYNVKNDYGNDKLYNENLKYSRDIIMLFKNLHRLELLAEKYTGGNDGSTSTYFTGKSDWLVFYYIRRLKYADTDSYKAVTGYEPEFVDYVSKNAVNLKTYFTNTNTFTINGATIDLKHMAASLAGNMYNTPSVYNLVYDEGEYDCLVSWAGDLHEFMEYNILKTGVKEKYGSYKDAVYNLMGDASTRFGMDDVYADIDNWNLYYNFRENKNLNIAEVFEQYYSGVSKRNYKNRYTSFITIMDSVGKSLGKTDFEGLVKHFTDTDKSWDTIGTLSIKPTEDEQTEIAEGFINWINDKAKLEK